MELERRNGRIDELLVQLDALLNELATIEAGVMVQEVRIRLSIHPSFAALEMMLLTISL